MRKFVLVVMLFTIVSGCKSEIPQYAARNTVESSTQAPSASTQEPENSKADVQHSKDFLYENKKLGFSLYFPASWEGKYQIKDSENGIRINFKINEEQTVFLHDIRIVTKEEWMTRKNQDYFGSFLGERNGYVYLERPPYEPPYDEPDKKMMDMWANITKQMADVLKTFHMLSDYDEKFFSQIKEWNGTIEKFMQQGYRVEERHVFKRNFEGMGELTITPVAKWGEHTDFPLSLVLTGGKKDIVLTPNRKDSRVMFSSFEAISFKDIDDYSLKSGYTDIIVIANFITGAGQDGAKPFSDVFIFKNDTWGNFIEDTELENKIISSANSRTLTMQKVFDLAKPVN